MKDYTDKAVREESRRLSILMENARSLIQGGTENSDGLYNLDTHLFLMENGWELMFPLKNEEWPEKFKCLGYDEEMKWPCLSTYCYVMDVIAPPFIPFIMLNFGYAIVEDKLIRSAFFVVQKMAEYQAMPQGMVIDPLAVRDGVAPSFYIGFALEKKEDVQALLDFRKNPLEMFVERRGAEKHEKELHDQYMRAYFEQMSFHPGWFPPQLIEFARENDLHIPPQVKRV